jgi:hypothetical protein
MGPSRMLAVTAGSVPVTFAVTITGTLAVTGTVTPARPSTLARPSILTRLTVLARPSILTRLTVLARPSILTRLTVLARLTVLVVVVPSAGAVGLLRTVRAVLLRRVVGLPAGLSVWPMASSVAAVRLFVARPFTGFARSLVASLRGTLGVAVRMFAGAATYRARPAPVGRPSVSSVADLTAELRLGVRRAIGLVPVGLRPALPGVPLATLRPLTCSGP